MKVKHRIVGIGNSIVGGFPLRRSECFLSRIRALTGYEVINKGVNGETTEDIIKRFNRDLLFHCPDIGILLTGTNDFIFKSATPEQAMGNIRWMVDKMKEENIRPVLLTPILTEPITASQHWMATANIDYREVNTQLKAMGRSMLAEFPEYTLDLQNLFKQAIQEKQCENVYIDGLHPTAEGHQIIAELIIEYLKEQPQ